jgi:hypothetical protein
MIPVNDALEITGIQTPCNIEEEKEDIHSNVQILPQNPYR